MYPWISQETIKFDQTHILLVNTIEQMTYIVTNADWYVYVKYCAWGREILIFDITTIVPRV